MVTVVAGPEVRNLPQLATGDVVRLTYYESVVASMAEPSNVGPGTATAMAARAPEGAKPAGLVGGTINVVVTMVSYDPATAVATSPSPMAPPRAWSSTRRCARSRRRGILAIGFGGADARGCGVDRGDEELSWVMQASDDGYGSAALPRPSSAAGHALELTGDRPKSMVSGVDRAHLGNTHSKQAVRRPDG